jgi:hypothetical protein
MSSIRAASPGFFILLDTYFYKENKNIIKL